MSRNEASIVQVDGACALVRASDVEIELAKAKRKIDQLEAEVAGLRGSLQAQSSWTGSTDLIVVE